MGKGKTDALWAPDTDAFLCDQHAMGGMDMTLLIEPNGTGENSIRVIGAAHVDERRERLGLPVRSD